MDLLSTLAPVEQTRQHHIYQCPIYIWPAKGKVRFNKHVTQEQWFVYIEYKDRFCASQFHVYEFKSLANAVHFMESECVKVELSDICPEKTRQHPIK
ncbi:hypothetical protein [Endozoicomonas arenosclerae]|uniref:hypothetical protein n=1 Tax=Endozoicomonas arenosclerae TaxID=1633495 RepID=UPI000A4A2F98|nr:hypothetical protein [Endozoicomonas arenosclerae]